MKKNSCFVRRSIRMLPVLLLLLALCVLTACTLSIGNSDDSPANGDGGDSPSAGGGNLSFSETSLDSVFVGEENVTLSEENQTALLAVLDSLRWYPAAAFSPEREATYTVAVRMTRVLCADADGLWSFALGEQTDITYFIDPESGWLTAAPSLLSTNAYDIAAQVGKADLTKLCRVFGCGDTGGTDNTGDDDTPPVPTGTFRLTVLDPGNYIYDKRPASEQYYTPSTRITLHALPILDADLAMYVDGVFRCLQTTVETEEGYVWEYTFIMPARAATLEFRVVGGDDYVYAGDLFPWARELAREDLVRVRTEHGYYGVAPGNLQDIAYSEDSADLDAVYRVLSSPLLPIRDEDGEIDGGGYTEYTFFTEDGAAGTLTIGNGNLYHNGQYYRYLNDLSPLASPTTECHAFFVYTDRQTLCTADGGTQPYTGLSALEFVAAGQDAAPAWDGRFWLVTEFGELKLLDVRHFLYEEVAYELVGERDFSDLFAEEREPG